MVLLYLLAERMPIDAIGVIHCNHQLRSQESHEHEASIVRDFCVSKGISYFYRVLNVAARAVNQGISEEMAARACRYEAFSDVMESNHFDCVALGHHLDDHIETLLLQLCRGAFASFVGIKPESIVNGIQVVRPLRLWEKSAILDFARLHCIEFALDESNFDVLYERNMIRKLILPLLRIGLPNCDSHVLALEQSVAAVVDASLARIPNGFKQPKQHGISEWSLDRVMCRQITDYDLGVYLARHWNAFMGITKVDPNETVISNLVMAMKDTHYREIPFGEFCVVMDQRVVQLRKSAIADRRNETYEIPLNGRVGFGLRCIQSTLLTSAPSIQDMVRDAPDTVYLSLPNSTESFVLRCVRATDVFHPLGAPGKKRVLDYLSDKGCGMLDRGAVYVLTYQEKIAWVVGWQIDNAFKVTQESVLYFKVQVESF